MKKRVLSLILVIMMLITAMPAVSLANTNNYKLDWLVQSGIVEGRGGGDLALAKNITRAEFAKMVLSVTGELSQANLYTMPSIFKDVTNEHWAKGIISYAAQRGYIVGYQDLSFRPDNYIKLDECITILARLNPGFTEPAIRSGYWAQPYIDYALSMGILNQNYTYDKYNSFALRETAFDIIYNEVQVYAAAKQIAEMETLRQLELEKARKEEEAKKEAERLKAEKEKEERESRRYRYDRDIEYRIYFDNNGGWGHMSTDYILGEGYYLLPWCRFEAPYGYHFDGWLVGRYRFEERDRVYIDRDVVVTPIWVKDGTTPDPKPNPDPDPDPTPDPTPDEKTFTVEFITDHGVAPKTVRVKEGNKVEKPADLSEDGYIFHGWYTEATFEHEYDFDKEVKESIKLYAKWEAIKYSIVVEESDNGSIEVEKTEGLIVGETVNIKATPEDGYQVNEITYTAEGAAPVKVNGTNFKMPASNITLKATFKIKEYNIAVNEVDGITITVPSSARKDAIVTLVVDLKPGYELVKITVVDAEGNPIELSADNTFTMPAKDVSISAELKKKEYSIEALEAENGTVSVDKAKATVGETIIVRAEAKDGYQLDKITYTIEGGEAVTVEGTSFKMPAGNVKVTATFKEKEYNITVDKAEGGSIEAVASAKTGADVTVVVNPDPGYELDKLTYTIEGSDAAVPIVNKTFTMPANNVSITATFKKTIYTIKVKDAEHGKVAANKEQATIGEEVVLSITPDKGYQVDKITYTIEGGEAVTVEGTSFKMPAGNIEITATFKEKEYNIIVTYKIHGEIKVKLNGNEVKKAKAGDFITLECEADPGYELAIINVTYKIDEKHGSLVDIDEGVTSATFKMPDHDVEVKAAFSIINSTIKEDVYNGLLKCEANNEPNYDEPSFEINIPSGKTNDEVEAEVNAGFKKYSEWRKGKYIQAISLGENYRTGFKYSFDGVTATIVSCTITFKNKYWHNKEQEAEINNYVDKFINEKITKDMSEYDKIKLVHDYIITHAAYIARRDEDCGLMLPLYTSKGNSTHSPYAIVSEELGVCQAYAGLFQKFMDKLGIESYFVTGKVKRGGAGETSGDGHAWNKVKIGDKYYNIDLTWDDPTDSSLPSTHQQASISGKENYDFFLRTDEFFNKSRTVDGFTELKADEDYTPRPSGKPGQ